MEIGSHRKAVMTKGLAAALSPCCRRGRGSRPMTAEPPQTAASPPAAGTHWIAYAPSTPPPAKDALYRSRARKDTLETALLATQLRPVLKWEGGGRYLSLKQGRAPPRRGPHLGRRQRPARRPPGDALPPGPRRRRPCPRRPGPGPPPRQPEARLRLGAELHVVVRGGEKDHRGDHS